MALVLFNLASATAVDIFTSGFEGYPCYRIPSALRLPSGRLMVFVEGRRGGDTGPNDVVYKTSDDEGESWSALHVLHSEYNASGPRPRNDIHSPCPLLINGTAFVIFGRNHRQLLAKRAIDASGTRWGPLQDLTQMVFNVSSVRGVTPGPAAGVGVPIGSRGERLVLGLAAPSFGAARGAAADAVAVGGEGDGGSAAMDAAGGGAAGDGVFGPYGGNGALLSDDGGVTWRLSGRASPRGDESQVALAPNGSLLLNMRGCSHAPGKPCGRGHWSQGVRWQSVSHDNGETWSLPATLNFGFGSACEGSIVRIPDGGEATGGVKGEAAGEAMGGPTGEPPRSEAMAAPSLLFSHPGRVHGDWGRWNMTVWHSADSGATWQAIEQVEPDKQPFPMPKLHTAYSALLPLGSPAPATSTAHAPVGLVYERGPMPGTHVVPSKCGEYATIRWHRVAW